MSIKQDRTFPRTALDLERKYNFGKTYAEMMGIILDEQKSIAEITGITTQLREDYKGMLARVTNTENGLSQTIRIAPNGVTITNASGDTLTIDGGQIDATNLNLSGKITWTDLSTSLSDDIADVAGIAGIADGTFFGGTFIDGRKIYSPEIYSNEFNVIPKDTDVSGSFNLYGYEASRLFHMLEISLFPATTPTIVFDSPADAHASWSFSKTMFSGELDFSRAKIIQPYFTIEEITSSTVSIAVFNTSNGDKITLIARNLSGVNTIEKTETSDGSIAIEGVFTGIPSNTYFEVGVSVNGNYIGYRTVKTTAS